MNHHHQNANRILTDNTNTCRLCGSDNSGDRSNPLRPQANTRNQPSHTSALAPKHPKYHRFFPIHRPQNRMRHPLPPIISRLTITIKRIQKISLHTNKNMTASNTNIKKNNTTQARKFLLLIALLPLTTIISCQKPLFSDRMPRTQYESYDRQHGTYAPATITDRNGQEQPNLRGRLNLPHG